MSQHHHHAHHPHPHAHHHSGHPAPVPVMIGAPSLMRLSVMQRLFGALALSLILIALLIWCLDGAGGL